MFSTFPGARPGAGLLLLRCALAAILIGQGYFCLLSWKQSQWFVRAQGITSAASGVLLLIGYMTPFASILAGLTCALSQLSWLEPRVPNAFCAKLQAPFGILISVALLCLGPGAFSIDCRLFGRREVIIPDASHDADHFEK